MRAWVVASFTLIASSQQVPDLRARVDLVEVDVVVTDTRGQVVRGLRASDFHVFEDKRPVEIASFREVTVSDAPIGGGQPAHGIPERDGRLLILVFDDWHVAYSPSVFNRTKDIARAIVGGLRGHDRLAMTATSGRASLHVDFTNDTTRLLGAIDALSPFPPDSRGTSVENAAVAWRGGTAVEALTSLATQLGEIPGRRKSIVLVGSGVPFDLQGDPRDATSRNLQDQFSQLIRAAQRANVAFYAFDPGVMDEATGPGAANLRVLAENTGGLANVNNNEFRPGVARLLAEAGHHYLLTYASPAVSDGQYHRILVEVRRAGLTVRARHGYQASRAK